MEKLTILQEEFFKELGELQQATVEIALGEYKEGSDIEDVFYRITSRLVCDVMALIDGCKKEHLQLDLVDRESRESLRTGLELHERCVAYIHFEKPKET